MVAGEPCSVKNLLAFPPAARFAVCMLRTLIGAILGTAFVLGYRHGLSPSSLGRRSRIASKTAYTPPSTAPPNDRSRPFHFAASGFEDQLPPVAVLYANAQMRI
jgi:hypothetical protein